MSIPDAVRSIEGRDRIAWFLAVLFYGIGDAVTTLVGLTFEEISEVGPIAAPLMAEHGELSFLFVKIATFLLGFGFWFVVRSQGRIAIPIALAVVGIVVTVWNAMMIASVFLA